MPNTATPVLIPKVRNSFENSYLGKNDSFYCSSQVHAYLSLRLVLVLICLYLTLIYVTSAFSLSLVH
jgi:hypothetical protein